MNSLIEHIFMVIKTKTKTKTSMPKQDKTIYLAIRSVSNIQTQVPEGRALVTFHNKLCCDSRDAEHNSL